MKILERFARWIGEVGPSPGFVAFNAHCWFAVFAVSAASRAGVPPIVAGVGWLAVFAAKEFWFDLKYEKPKQDWLDSVEDFLGYAAGIILGIGLSGLHIL